MACGYKCNRQVGAPRAGRGYRSNKILNEYVYVDVTKVRCPAKKG
jgi:hypothetical protein